ncbi:MAG: adenylate/guanylate cyclase domain-containing protein [Leptospirales bacterium]|nr:adenylate/guanylate cyclase domain-containing protein [Leptospirales bacterium]
MTNSPLSFLRTLQRSSMSPAMRTLLSEEEHNGARFANRFRYIVWLLLTILALSLRNAKFSPLVNSTALGLYIAITLVHSYLLTRPYRPALQTAFSAFTIVFDYVLIYAVLMYYTFISSSDNYSFAIKNPVLLITLFPLLTTALQFQFRLLFLALLVHLGALASLIVITFRQPIILTDDWFKYVMGPEVIPGDLILSRPIVFAGAGVLLAYIIARALQMVQRIGAAEIQRQNLARYFSPQIVAELAENGETLASGGRRRVTILFSDIRNFTRMSEDMDPQELAAFLGEFRERMTEVIFAAGGTLDKFVGDAIMAIFGAPRSLPEQGGDARAALHAARGMLEALHSFNEDRRGRGLAAVQIGIGLHSGEVFAGNVGQGSRLEYTVIGDAVNTASRIESLCKKFQATLLASEATMLEAGGVEGERMPRVMVKGKSAPLQVFRLAKLAEETSLQSSSPLS